MLNEHISQIHSGSPQVAHSTPWYRRERWLVVCIAAVVPVVGAIVAPQSWKIPLAVAGGVLMSTSMVMLIRHQQSLRTGERDKTS